MFLMQLIDEDADDLMSQGIARSSSVKKGVFRNFAKFTEKYLCQSLFFNKIAGFQACNFIKEETLT